MTSSGIALQNSDGSLRLGVGSQTEVPDLESDGILLNLTPEEKF